VLDVLHKCIEQVVEKLHGQPKLPYGGMQGAKNVGPTCWFGWRKGVQRMTEVAQGLEPF